MTPSASVASIFSSFESCSPPNYCFDVSQIQKLRKIVDRFVQKHFSQSDKCFVLGKSFHCLLPDHREIWIRKSMLLERALALPRLGLSAHIKKDARLSLSGYDVNFSASAKLEEGAQKYSVHLMERIPFEGGLRNHDFHLNWSFKDGQETVSECLHKSELDDMDNTHCFLQEMLEGQDGLACFEKICDPKSPAKSPSTENDGLSGAKTGLGAVALASAVFFGYKTYKEEKRCQNPKTGAENRDQGSPKRKIAYAAACGASLAAALVCINS